MRAAVTGARRWPCWSTRTGREAEARASQGGAPGAPTFRPAGTPAAPRWLPGALALLALLAGPPALAAKRTPAPTAPTTNVLVWPEPPAPPRIAFVQSIDRPADAGVKLGAYTKFANWVAGGDKGNERLVKPFGLALDDEGNLLLTDTALGAVSCFERKTKKWRRWLKAGPVRFAAPVAVARKGPVIFVADTGLGAVLAFNLDGKLQFQITNHLTRPAGLALQGDRLWVADSQRHAIVGFDLRGRFVSEFGRRGSQPGEFNFPTHLAADTAGRLYVTDSMNCRVQVCSPDGQCESQIGSAGDRPGHFGRPKGVAVDGAGRVYVLDALFDSLQVFDRGGPVLLSLGGSGQRPGEFWLPNGIAISPGGEIYVADCYNGRVQVFRYVGQP